MIPEAKAVKLIKVYLYVCKRFEEDLKYNCQRFSNNCKPELSDEEIITIYLYAIQEEQRFKVKHIHRFADEYLRSWFPSLGSYQAFNNRINRLSEAFKQLLSILISDFTPENCCLNPSLLDSMPIILSSGKRTPKVATEIVDKGKCASKGMYYHGLKLHALAFWQENKLPFPEQLLVTSASVNDLTVFKDAWSDLDNRCFYGDKIYQNKEFFEDIKQEKNSIMLTPVKAVKGQTEIEKQRNKAADDLFSRFYHKFNGKI